MEKSYIVLKKSDFNKKIHLTLSISQFIGRLLVHIPLENIKMIRKL
ncbi:transposase [Cetobacterium ceti]|nr:transposase [Cetobacterium ceti]